MKQFSLIACGIFAVATTSCSQIKVPAAVTKAFNSKYPGATNVKWGKESAKEYEAEFKFSGTGVSANFGLDGSWKETETTVNTNELPAAVNDAIKTKYPGAVIFLTERIEKPENKIFYEVNIKVKGKKKELELDINGSFVK